MRNKVSFIIIIVLIILGSVFKISAQTQIKYHDRFLNKNMQWSEFNIEGVGYSEVLIEDNNEYYIESANQEMVYGFAKLKIDATKSFKYSFNCNVDESVFIGLSNEDNKIGFEINIGNRKFRVFYPKNKKQKVSKWYKFDEHIINQNSDFSNIEIIFTGNKFKFYFSNNLLYELPEKKYDKLTYFTKLEIGTNIVIDIYEVFIEASVFLEDNQNFMLSNGISDEELNQKETYSIKDIVNDLQEDDYLKVYKLSIYTDINELPEEVLKCHNIQDVSYTGHGDCSNIFNQLKEFDYLKRLYTDTVPLNVSGLVNLRKLSAPYTVITKQMLQEIFKLKKLKVLELGDVERYGFPPILYNYYEGIENLINLEYLDLESTGLESFPLEILKLKKLKYLNLRQNPIKELPANISELKNLKEVLIED